MLSFFIFSKMPFVSCYVITIPTRVGALVLVSVWRSGTLLYVTIIYQVCYMVATRWQDQSFFPGAICVGRCETTAVFLVFRTYDICVNSYTIRIQSTGQTGHQHSPEGMYTAV